MADPTPPSSLAVPLRPSLPDPQEYEPPLRPISLQTTKRRTHPANRQLENPCLAEFRANDLARPAIHSRLARAAPPSLLALSCCTPSRDHHSKPRRMDLRHALPCRFVDGQKLIHFPDLRQNAVGLLAYLLFLYPISDPARLLVTPCLQAFPRRHREDAGATWLAQEPTRLELAVPRSFIRQVQLGYRQRFGQM